jgi:hypothetical protein
MNMPPPDRSRRPDSPPKPSTTASPGAPGSPSPGEAVWRNLFFYFSAFMGALALLDFDAGRIAHGMGDLGVASLLLSLLPQFSFVRAVVGGGATDKDRERMLEAAQRFRAEHPWSDRFGRMGWALLLSSLVLRALGLG